MNRTMATMTAVALAMMLSACSGGDGQTPQTDETQPGSIMDRDTTPAPQTMPEDRTPDSGSSFGDGNAVPDMDTSPEGSNSQP
jgi:hypothetical protein